MMGLVPQLTQGLDVMVPQTGAHREDKRAPTGCDAGTFVDGQRLDVMPTPDGAIERVRARDHVTCVWLR